MNRNNRIISIGLAGLVLLPGCIGIRNYQLRPLELSKNGATYHKTNQGGIALQVRPLTSHEKNCLFDGHIVPLDGCKAVYLSVSNISDKCYSIAPDGINILQVSFRDIKKSVKKTDTFAYFSGALTTGVIVAAPIALAFCYVASAPVAIAALVALPFEAMFLAKSGRSAVMNHRIDKDLREKVLHRKIFIKSGKKYEGLIFVKKSDYTPQFSVTLHEKGNRNNSIVFDVNLDKS